MGPTRENMPPLKSGFWHSLNLGRLEILARIRSKETVITDKTAQTTTSSSPRRGIFEQISGWFSNKLDSSSARIAEAGDQSQRGKIKAGATTAVASKSLKHPEGMRVKALFSNYNPTKTDKNLQGFFKNKDAQQADRVRNYLIKWFQSWHLKTVNNLREKHEGDLKKFNEEIQKLNVTVDNINDQYEKKLLNATTLYDYKTVTGGLVLYDKDGKEIDQEINKGGLHKGINNLVSEIELKLNSGLSNPFDVVEITKDGKSSITDETAFKYINEKLNAAYITEDKQNSLIEELTKKFTAENGEAMDTSDKVENYKKKLHKEYDADIGKLSLDIETKGYQHRLNPPLVEKQKFLPNYSNFWKGLNSEKGKARNIELKKIKDNYNHLTEHIETQFGTNINRRNKLIRELNSKIQYLNQSFESQGLGTASPDTITKGTFTQNVDTGQLILGEGRGRRGYSNWVIESQKALSDFKQKHNLLDL